MCAQPRPAWLLMGFKNAREARRRWPDLPDLPWRILQEMAWLIGDDDLYPKYWGGWEAIAEMAGRRLPEPDKGDADVIRRRNAVRREITRALTALREAGALTVVSRGRPGRNAAYLLMIRDGTGDTTVPHSNDRDGSNVRHHSPKRETPQSHVHETPQSH